MARAASQDIVVLGSRRKAKLEAIVRRPSSPQALVRRARIVLLAHQGLAERADRRRAGLLGEHGPDLAAPVRPRRHAEPVRPAAQRPAEVYGPDVRLAIVATATSAPPDGASVWTHGMIAAHLAGTGISASQVGRILAGLELAPHRVRGWLNRRDDGQFWAQAAAVCEVYLHPPEHTVVICIDEKTGIQAKYRRYPERPPGRAGWPGGSSNTSATAPCPSSPRCRSPPARSSPSRSAATTRPPSSASCTAWTSASTRA